MDGISFQSRIRPANLGDFYAQTHAIGERGFVDYPWTINQSVLRKGAFTCGVRDCTVCGITDGDKVLLMHICPTMRENKNFKKIEEFVNSKIAFMDHDYLQGFLLGSQGKAPGYSRVLFDKFSELLEKLKIPTSKLRAGDEEVNIAYLSEKDEWIIATKDIPALMKNMNSEETILDMFEEVTISKFDEIA